MLSADSRSSTPGCENYSYRESSVAGPVTGEPYALPRTTFGMRDGRPRSSSPPPSPERAHMRRFLIWLSGARSEVLARCPTDHGKYEGIGSAVLITSVMAGISMTFALNTALMVSLPFAIGFGL